MSVQFRKLTDGNIENINRLLFAFKGSISSCVEEEHKGFVRDLVNALSQTQGDFYKLRKANQIVDTDPKQILDPDQTVLIQPDEGWETPILLKFIQEFGRYGTDAISSVHELMLYSDIIAEMYGSELVFFRGESQYGWTTTSRAERHLSVDELSEPGLHAKELEQLRRFQEEFRTKPDPELVSKGALPDNDSPLWLPIMQHYDEAFGTRLLDITTSPFAALYFACVEWDGSINDKIDGIVKCYFLGNVGSLPIKGFFYDNETEPHGFDRETDEMAGASVTNMFF